MNYSLVQIKNNESISYQVKGGLLLNVVVGQGPAVLQLLAGKDEPLLVGRNALLVLSNALCKMNHDDHLCVYF